jgi:hypothetical protein
MINLRSRSGRELKILQLNIFGECIRTERLFEDYSTGEWENRPIDNASSRARMNDVKVTI